MTVTSRTNYPGQGKLERTRPFYIAQFEALKGLTEPEVRLLAVGEFLGGCY